MVVPVLVDAKNWKRTRKSNSMVIAGSGKRREASSTFNSLRSFHYLYLFCGWDPPGLRTLGEVAPENIYSDRSFKYLSEVRRKRRKSGFVAVRPENLLEILLVRKVSIRR